jgi:hypothetical protein
MEDVRRRLAEKKGTSTRSVSIFVEKCLQFKNIVFSNEPSSSSLRFSKVMRAIEYRCIAADYYRKYYSSLQYHNIDIIL